MDTAGTQCISETLWVLTFSWCKTEVGSGRKSKQHRARSGLLVMVSVMDSDRTRVWWTGRWQPILPAWHRDQLGDMLQDTPVPLPARTSFTQDHEYVPYTGFFPYYQPFLKFLLVSLLLPSSLLSSHILLEGVVIFLPLTQGTRVREVQRSHSGFLNTWVCAETPQLWGVFPARGNQSKSDLVLTTGRWKLISSPGQEHFVSLQH